MVVSLSTVSDEGTRAWWPHDFRLVHRAIIGAALTQETGDDQHGAAPRALKRPCTRITAWVGRSRSYQWARRSGVPDNTDGNREKRQEGDIVFTAQTDRAYLETTHAVEIADPLMRRRIRLEKKDSRTTVVWNPWSTGAKCAGGFGRRRMEEHGLRRSQQYPRFSRRSCARGRAHDEDRDPGRLSLRLGLVAVAIDGVNQGASQRRLENM